MISDPFKQAITSMASALVTLLLAGMFSYVMGCLVPLCLRWVLMKMATFVYSWSMFGQ